MQDRAVTPLTHAGGVVRRETEAGATFLLVRASRPPFDWVLPKGHIEDGEVPEQTAQREVAEEAGVLAEIERPAGDLVFEVRGQTVSVRYFVMRYSGDVKASEQRDVRWCSREECERLLLYEDNRELVRRAGRP